MALSLVADVEQLLNPLTFTTLCANSADDKLVTFFEFFQKTGFDLSCKMTPFSIGDNLHENSKPVFWEK